MIIWVNLVQNYMFIVFSYCTFSLILNSMEINIDISIDEDTILVYSYFEKGCRTKCTRQSRKVLWVVLSSLFFKEI